MSIYEKGASLPKMSFAFIGKIPGPIFWGIIIILIIVVVYAFFTMFPYALTKSISFSFDKNPIKANEQVLLSVIVTNISGTTAENVVVGAAPVDAKSFSVDRPIQNIEVLDRSRKLTYLINPIGPVKPGEYEFVISTTINGDPFSEKAVLTVAE